MLSLKKPAQRVLSILVTLAMLLYIPGGTIAAYADNNKIEITIDNSIQKNSVTKINVTTIPDKMNIIWSVEGASNICTEVATPWGGPFLKVSAKETADQITLKAVSATDPKISSSVDITLTDAPEATEDDIVFDDPFLEMVVKQNIGKPNQVGYIKKEQVENLQKVETTNYKTPITDLGGLENFPKLKNLKLYNDTLTNFNALKDNKILYRIEVESERIFDFSGLNASVKSKTLNMNSMQFGPINSKKEIEVPTNVIDNPLKLANGKYGKFTTDSEDCTLEYNSDKSRITIEGLNNNGQIAILKYDGQNDNPKTRISAELKVKYVISGQPADYVTSLDLIEPSAEIEAGTKGKFKADVKGNGDFNPEVTWELVGEHAANTTLNNKGELSVDIDEKAASLGIKVTTVDKTLNGETLSKEHTVNITPVSKDRAVSIKFTKPEGEGPTKVEKAPWPGKYVDLELEASNYYGNVISNNPNYYTLELDEYYNDVSVSISDEKWTLSIGEDAPINTEITVTAKYNNDPYPDVTAKHKFIVVGKESPTSVEINGPDEIQLKKDEAVIGQYSAKVKPDSVSQVVIWSIKEDVNKKANIHEDTGVLTVGSGFDTNAHPTLTVVAKALDDQSIFAEKTVRILPAEVIPPSFVKSVKITAPVKDSWIKKGENVICKADVEVEGEASKDLLWSISGNNSDSTKITLKEGLTYQLTVADDETAKKIQITATAMNKGENDETVSDTIEVNIGEPESPYVKFNDNNLKKAVKAALKITGTEVTKEQMLQLEELNANRKFISDLTGLEFATNLKRANLSQNRISNLEPLKNCTSMEQLLLGKQEGFGIQDIAPLSGMTKLEKLTLGREAPVQGKFMQEPVRSFGALADMTNLKELSLEFTGFKADDLKYLAKSVNTLDKVNLEGSFLKDIPELQNLSNTSELNLSGTNFVRDENGKAKLTTENELLDGITNISDFNNLKSITLSNTRVADMNPLAKNANIEEIHASWLTSKTGAEFKLDKLHELKKLKVLELNYDNIKDLSFLRGMDTLENLWLTTNAIEDISIIGELTNLKKLGLGNLGLSSNSGDVPKNKFNNIECLGKLTQLIHLDLWDTEIQSLHGIENMEKLNFLSLPKCHVIDLSPIKAAKLKGSPLAQVNFNNQSRSIEGSDLVIDNPAKDAEGRFPKFTKSSKDKGHAQVQMSEDNSKISFTNLAPGESITIEYKSSKPFGSMLITYTLTEKVVKDLILSADKTNLKIGEKAKLTAKLIPEGSVGDVKYSIDKPDVISLDKDLTITAKSEGTAVITAKVNNIEKTVKINVTKSGSGSGGSGGSSGGGGSSSSSGDSKVQDKLPAKTITDDPTPTTSVESNQSNNIASKFIDIKGGWYEEAVIKAVEAGYFVGTSENTFSPEKSMTRGMFVTVLGRYLKAPTDKVSNFKDVDTTIYYAPYIAWAAEEGIVKGISDTKFAPEENITREQMSAIIQRTILKLGKELPSGNSQIKFSDDAKISDYAKTAVYQLVDAGILKGMPDNSFAPNAKLTRAQAAAVMVRLGEKLV